MMLIRPFCKPVVLATTCFALFSASCLATVSPEAPAGNAVVILVDDLGWRDLACMGSPVYETPHIDALAAPQPVVEKYRQKIAAMKQAGRDLQGHDNPVYAAMIEETDRSVGAIIDKLEALQLREKTLGERNLFWNFPSYNDPEYPARRPRSALRRGDWKIIHRYEENGYELYNLKTDIGESTDLSQSHPEILQEMREQLADSYQRFGAASSLPPNPNYEPAP